MANGWYSLYRRWRQQRRFPSLRTPTAINISAPPLSLYPFSLPQQQPYAFKQEQQQQQPQGAGDTMRELVQQAAAQRAKTLTMQQRAQAAAPPAVAPAQRPAGSTTGAWGKISQQARDRLQQLGDAIARQGSSAEARDWWREELRRIFADEPGLSAEERAALEDEINRRIDEQVKIAQQRTAGQMQKMGLGLSGAGVAAGLEVAAAGEMQRAKELAEVEKLHQQLKLEEEAQRLGALRGYAELTAAEEHWRAEFERHKQEYPTTDEWLKWVDSQLDQLVKEGKLTQEEADNIYIALLTGEERALEQPARGAGLANIPHYDLTTTPPAVPSIADIVQWFANADDARLGVLQCQQYVTELATAGLHKQIPASQALNAGRWRDYYITTAKRIGEVWQISGEITTPQQAQQQPQQPAVATITATAPQYATDEDRDRLIPPYGELLPDRRPPIEYNITWLVANDGTIALKLHRRCQEWLQGLAPQRGIELAHDWAEAWREYFKTYQQLIEQWLNRQKEG